MASREEIRAMDGEALTHLAYALWLAVPQWPGQSILYFGQDLWVCHESAFSTETVPRWLPVERWQPHTDLAQADSVLRQLRARGWKTLVVGGAVEGDTCGAVWAEHLPTGQPQVMVPWDGAQEEACALLRCSVLAVASSKEP